MRTEVLDDTILVELLELAREVRPNMVRELLDKFKVESVRYLDEMAAAMTKQDYAFIERTAHSFKGTAGMLGAIKVHQGCNDLEQRARKQDATLTVQEIETIRYELKRAIVELDAYPVDIVAQAA